MVQQGTVEEGTVFQAPTDENTRAGTKTWTKLMSPYDGFMQENVKHIGDERLEKVPSDLDLKPYRDEHDYDLVQRMIDCIARNEGPAGVTVEQVHAAIDKHMPHLKKYKPKAGKKASKTRAKKR